MTSASVYLQAQHRTQGLISAHRHAPTLAVSGDGTRLLQELRISLLAV